MLQIELKCTHCPLCDSDANGSCPTPLHPDICKRAGSFAWATHAVNYTKSRKRFSSTLTFLASPSASSDVTFDVKVALSSMSPPTCMHWHTYHILSPAAMRTPHVAFATVQDYILRTHCHTYCPPWSLAH